MANILKFFSALLTYKLMPWMCRHKCESHRQCWQVLAQG